MNQICKILERVPGTQHSKCSASVSCDDSGDGGGNDGTYDAYLL